MKRILIIVAATAALFAVSATAAAVENVTFQQDLTREEIAQLQYQAAKMAADRAAVGKPAEAAQNVREWVDIGTAIGSGLASTAKELGVAANEFAQTPVGKFAMVIIAWHFLGDSLIHFVFGVLWLLIAGGTWVVFYKRAQFATVVTEYADPKRKEVARQIRRLSEGQAGGYIAMLIIIIVVGVVAIFTA